MVVDLIHEMRQQKPGYPEAVRGLVLALMAKLQRLPNLGTTEKATSDKWQLRQIYPALLHMRQHYQEKIHISDLATICHMGISTFREIFHKNIGKSPSQFLMQNRISMAAAQMHATQDKILKVALDNGFPTISSFNRAFQKAKGMSPRKWRQEHTD